MERPDYDKLLNDLESLRWTLVDSDIANDEQLEAFDAAVRLLRSRAVGYI